jgi:alpha-methylacyl-CoA racemase
LTGWGQEGPLAQSAGPDINFISLTGALHEIGPPDGKPTIPLNLLVDKPGLDPQKFSGHGFDRNHLGMPF